MSRSPAILLGLLTACHGSASTTAPDAHVAVDAHVADAHPKSPDATAHPPDAMRPAPKVDATAFVPVDVTTQHNDVARTGVNANETILTAANVKASTFGKLLTIPVDGLLFAQPLVLSGFTIAGKSRTVVYAATAHDSVYALDGDSGEVLWKTSLGTPVPTAQIGLVDAAAGSPNIPVELGVLSTPVIDRATGVLYVTCSDYHGAGVPQTQALHVLDLTTGADVAGSPAILTATVPGTGDGTGTITFIPNMESQRPALLLSGGVVYLGFAAHDDYRPFHGFVLGYRYDAAAGTITQTNAFTTSADGYGAGIWASGQGIVADDAGDLYLMTGNGTTNVQDGGLSYGQSFLRLSPTLTVLDWFVVAGFEGFNVADWDLGAGGPVLIPGTHFLTGGGKQGTLYLVDTTNLGHFAADADGGIVQSFQVTDTPFEGIFGAPIVWNGDGTTRVYIWGVNDPLKEYQLANGRFETTPIAQTTVATPPVAGPGGGNPVGALSLSANGDKGIVWAAIPLANPNMAIVAGELYAFDAVTLDLLWSSEQSGTRDQVGNHAKFVPPTVANGKVYLATQSKAVVVYGLL